MKKWVLSLKDKKSLQKLWFQDNDMERYSTHNGGKFIVAEKFIKTLKNKIYKHMTSIQKLRISIR